MARQEELFPKPEQTIAIHSSRRDAPLWVRRLVLWAKPGEVIRDIPLRRGLNVIWSPDPGPRQPTSDRMPTAGTARAKRCSAACCDTAWEKGRFRVTTSEGVLPRSFRTGWSGQRSLLAEPSGP